MKKLCRKSGNGKGLGKVKFNSHESAARRAMKILEWDPSKKHLRTYLCHHCKHWHLTSNA